ncbi:MAG: polymerase sigma-54 factor [Pseudomonadota bacterium]
MAQSRLRLSQNQKLGLTPAMRKSLAILQASATALDDIVRAEAEANPFLDLAGPALPASSRSGIAGEILAVAEGLYHSLARQIMASRAGEEVVAAALVLASELREDGFLDSDPLDIAETSGIDSAVILRGLALLQGCEPAGVGARHLPECLILQLVDKGLGRPAAERVVAHLPDLVAGRERRPGALTGLSAERTEWLMGIIPTLRARPYEPEEAEPATDIPDLIVSADSDQRLSVSLNRAACPRLRVLDIGPLSDLRPEQRELARRAAELAGAVTARGETVLRIGRLIAEVQRAFFGPGQPQLVPLRARDAASRLGLHPSTVSRAIRGKSLSFRGRVHPLSTFFQSGIASEAGELSVFVVQSRLRTLIADEDADNPLADEDLANHLRKEGVDIARRTVAKYRKWMRIPPSFARRRRRA